MSINLQKGQKVDLTKGNAGLKGIMVGLGWDPIEQKSGGMFGGLFGGGGSSSFDCDASVIMLRENDKFKSKDDLVYFGNLRHKSDSVRHMGDNLTGAGDGDDEQIFIDLSRIPADINKLVFVVNIYDCVSRKQHFGMVRNAFIRIVDSNNSKEMLKFNLTDSYTNKTALIVGEVYRYQGEWKFAAVGEGTSDTSLGMMVKKYQ